MEKQSNRYIILAAAFMTVVIAAFSPNAREWCRSFLGAVSPLYGGFFLAFVLNIPVRRLESLFSKKINRIKLVRILAISAVYLVFAGLIILLFTVLLPMLSESLERLYGNLDVYLLKIESIIISVAEKFGRTNSVEEMIANINNQLLSYVGELTRRAGGAVISVGTGIGKGIYRFLLAMIVSIYVLFGKDSLLKSTSSLIDRWMSAGKAQKFREFLSITSKKMSLFIGGQLLDAVLLGGLCAVGMVIIGLPYSPLIGMIIAITALVPIVGAWMGGAISGIIIAMESPIKALIFIVFLIVLQQLENNLLYPKIVGDALGLKGLWVIVGVTVGGALFGIWGMLLGAPACAIIQQYLEFSKEKIPNKQ